MFSDSAVLFCVVVNMVKINTYLILIPYTYRVRLQDIIKDLANREGARTKDEYALMNIEKERKSRLPQQATLQNHSGRWKREE